MFDAQDNDFDNNKTTKLDSITVNRNPGLDNDLSNKKYIDDEMNKDIFCRFNQTIQNYLLVDVENSVYNLKEYDRNQIIDATNNKTVNAGLYLLPL